MKCTNVSLDDCTLVFTTGAAGLIVSINRIVTKAFLPNSSVLNTFLFFLLSAAILLLCCVLFHVTKQSNFVRFVTSFILRKRSLRYKPRIAVQNMTDRGGAWAYTNQHAVLYNGCPLKRHKARTHPTADLVVSAS